MTVKVLSLLPSATEIVYALGAEELLCGVSCDCDHPAAVVEKPVVSSRLLPIDDETSPREIDDLVRAQLNVSDSIYELDRELIRTLRPDVILAQDLCRVCAVPSGHVEEALDVIGCTAEVLSLDPHSLDDVLANVRDVGRALGMERRASSVVAELRARLDAVRAAVSGTPSRRVVALEWQDPLYTAGHWVPEMIALAGGTDLIGAPGARSVRISWSDAADAAPDVIVYMPCGYGLDDALAQAAAFEHVPEFRATPAAASGEVYATNSSAYFSRSGPRLVDGVEILAGLLQPERWPAPSARDAVRI